MELVKSDALLDTARLANRRLRKRNHESAAENAALKAQLQVRWAKGGKVVSTPNASCAACSVQRISYTNMRAAWVQCMLTTKAIPVCRASRSTALVVVVMFVFGSCHTQAMEERVRAADEQRERQQVQLEDMLHDAALLAHGGVNQLSDGQY